jgi:hypothetical protein
MTLFSTLNYPEIIFEDNRPREDDIVTNLENHYNLNIDEMKIVKIRKKK